MEERNRAKAGGKVTSAGFANIYKTNFYIEKSTNKPGVSPYQKYHYHNGYELYYIYSGERHYFIKDKTYHVESGSFVLIKPYEIHSAGNCAESERVIINFRKEYIDKLLDAAGIENPFECFEENVHTIRLDKNEQVFVEALFKEMIADFSTDGAEGNAFLKTSLMQLILFINKLRRTSDEKMNKYINSTHKLVSEAAGYINNNFARDITLELISDMFFVSPCYFSRVFKKVSGMSFTDYLNNVRVKEAQNLLYKTDMNIAEITEAAGFKSNTHFDRVFKGIVGVSPLAYRKEARR